MSMQSAIREMQWPAEEKKIARRAFDAALQRQCDTILAAVKSMAATASSAEDLWKLDDYLAEQRRQIDQVYDYRYSMLIIVFGRLLGDGWLSEADLEGLSEDKLEHIRGIAKWRREEE